MARLTFDAIESALAARAPLTLGEEIPAQAAVALVLREGPGGIEALFIRRAEHPQDPWSGQMAFPGGRAEPQDPDLRTTAVRETAEELCLDLERSADFLGALDEVRAMARLRPMGLSITPFVFRLRDPEAELRPSDEVRSAHWISLDELIGVARHSTFDYEDQGTRLQFPCLRFDDFVIWGLTYRMFMSFRSLFSDMREPPGPPEWPGRVPA